MLINEGAKTVEKLLNVVQCTNKHITSLPCTCILLEFLLFGLVHTLSPKHFRTNTVYTAISVALQSYSRL